MLGSHHSQHKNVIFSLMNEFRIAIRHWEFKQLTCASKNHFAVHALCEISRSISCALWYKFVQFRIRSIPAALLPDIMDYRSNTSCVIWHIWRGLFVIWFCGQFVMTVGQRTRGVYVNNRMINDVERVDVIYPSSHTILKVSQLKLLWIDFRMR